MRNTRNTKMAAPKTIVLKQVKPIFSRTDAEARRRVIALYKTWYRQIPYIVLGYDIPKSEEQCKQKLREEFRRHDYVKDLRVIDLLVIKGHMELQETANFWKTKGGLMNFWKETYIQKPTDFMSKFFSGHD